MNPAKQHRKLHKLLSRAEVCLTRDEAQKILKKAAKTQKKLEKGPVAENATETILWLSSIISFWVILIKLQIIIDVKEVI